MDVVSEAVRYVPRPGETSILVCLAVCTRSKGDDQATSPIPTCPVPIPTYGYNLLGLHSTYISCHVMSCLPDLRRCATRLV